MLFRIFAFVADLRDSARGGAAKEWKLTRERDCQSSFILG